MGSLQNYKPRALAALVAAGLSGAALAQNPDADAVAQLLVTSFDKPEAHLVPGPIVVEEDVSIAGWSQGDLGGRALLRRKDGAWSIVLCAGDALKDAKTLESAGVPKEAAQALAVKLAAAESTIPAQRLALFSRFDGMVQMDANGGHQQADPHHAQKP